MAQETAGARLAPASELVRAARVRLAGELDQLPAWGTPQLWARIHSTVPQQSVSFGALAHLIRVAVGRGESHSARELFVLLLERSEGLNRRWAEQTVRNTSGLRGPAGLAVREDLRQELTLRLWEAVALDGGEAWELFFQRSLAYAQRHTATAYMEQRGYWSRRVAGRRVPLAVAAGGVVLASTALVTDGAPEQHALHTLPAPDMAVIGGDFTAAELADLRDLVARLPREQRIAVVLRHWQQAPETEIAQALGVTTRTVRNYLRRAYASLREWYC